MLRRSVSCVPNSSRSRVIAGSGGIFSGTLILLCVLHYSTVSAAESKIQDARIPWYENNTAVSIMLLIGAVAMLAFEILDFVTKNLGLWTGAKSIPVRGKHLDDLRTVDSLCIAFSKANTAPFTYLFCRYCWFADAVVWHWKDVSVLNFPLATLLLFLAFDASYCILHWILHWQILYKWVHKHHHVQKAPSRGSVDAANVHPIEMILGEYNHILALWIVSTFATRVHVAAAFFFLILGGVMAGVNHTRHDLTVTVAGVRLFDSKAHDVHHRIPQSNYGQYTMFWDHVFGTYRYVARSVGAGRSHAFLLLAARMTPMIGSTPSLNSIPGQGKRSRYPRLSTDKL